MEFFHEGKPIAVTDENARRNYAKVVQPKELSVHKKEDREKWFRFWFQTVQMLAAGAARAACHVGGRHGR